MTHANARVPARAYDIHGADLTPEACPLQNSQGRRSHWGDQGDNGRFWGPWLFWQSPVDGSVYTCHSIEILACMSVVNKT